MMEKNRCVHCGLIQDLPHSHGCKVTLSEKGERGGLFYSYDSAAEAVDRAWEKNR